jgi:kelch-like protein 26
MKILKNIRFNEICVQDVERLLKSLSIRKNDQFYHMIWYLLDPQCSKEQEETMINSCAKNALINYRGMELAIIKIGGFKLTGITNEITYCFPNKGNPHSSVESLSNWRHLTTIPHIKQSSFGTAVLNNNIYCVGGSYDISLEEYIHPFGFKYCPISNKWTTISPMNQDRCRFSLNVLDNCLIAVGGNSELEDEAHPGGFQDHTNFSTAEKYDPETDKWEYVARIPEYR